MADEKQRENGAYTKSEMTRIVIDDQVQPDPVPAAWIGTDLLPAGAKKATRAQVTKADSGEDDGSDAGSSSDSGSGSGDSGSSGS